MTLFGSKSLDDIIWTSTRSHKCDLSNQEMTTLPPQIGQLRSARLRDLWLSDNQLRRLPSEIGRLTTLRELYLDGNHLTTLPSEIALLINLRKLHLDGNHLSTLPPEIGRLISLEVLVLDGNRLTALPPEIGLLANLRELRLDGNQLKALLPEIGQLTNLQVLTINGNRLSALPPEISKVKRPSLRVLLLTENQLTVLPPQIGELTNLRELCLDKNQLTALPLEISQLARLEKLALTGNQLATVPEEIGQLNNLQDLRLDNNQLTTLPREIGQLTNLRELGLTGNQLTTLPSEISQLTSLEVLTLNGNQLATLSQIGQLTNLRELGLTGNQLTTLPSEISQLTSLEVLTLNGNQLAVLPPEIGQLFRLRELELTGNQLISLPPEIGQLFDLQVLNVAGNQLGELPTQLAELLSNGLVIHLRDNPLEGPILELIDRGSIAALGAYLRSLGDATPQYEGKVLLVGEGNVGKTSLVAALTGDPFIEGRPTTHGIQIRSLPLRHPTYDVPLTLRSWDFGGQEVYKITHQFFFTKHALYLVVWKPREGQEQNEVEGWLRRIRLRVSTEGRALVVATHCAGDRHPDLDYPTLRKSFPHLLAGLFEVDNYTRLGIFDLQEAIATEAANLPQMGQLLSPRWIAARDEILGLANAEPQISFEQFASICQRHGVEYDQATALAELLHILGHVVFYGDDQGLRDFVVLNPEWLTKAISYVLEDDHTRAAGGILNHARLKNIWENRLGEEEYPSRYHPYFLRLMEKFDVSYRLEDDQHCSLVAQLTPHDRPNLPWDSTSPLLEGVRRLELVCRLSEPVPGLIAWLTVRHHRASTGNHWRSGVFLRHPIDAYSSEAVVELRESTHLAVEVRAPSPDYFFNVLRDSIEDLMSRRWPGLNYELLIPCPSLNAGSRCADPIPMKGLLRYREVGETHYRCMKCLTKHDLSVLLTGFAHPVLSLQPELDRIHSEITGVRIGINDLRANSAAIADMIRRILRAITAEVTDCPRLFTISSETSVGMSRLRPDQERYRLTLWCEHPGHWHPWLDASYSIVQSKPWVLSVAPYARLIFKALQLIVPVASAAAGVILTPAELKEAQNQLKLMSVLVSELPTKQPVSPSAVTASQETDQVTESEGAAWRALRSVVFQQDLARNFGGLRRIQAPSGDFLWVCPNHYSIYDPGLPPIPGA